ncbi:hypothetical protein LINPERHAP1_LOCUS30253 [Linum perenne]
MLLTRHLAAMEETQIADLREILRSFDQDSDETLSQLEVAEWNLPRPHLNPFSCATSSSNSNNPQQLADHEYYTNFCNELECDLDMVLRLNSNNTIMLPAQSISHPSSPLKMEGGKEEKKSSHSEIYGFEQEQGSVNRIKKKKKITKKKSSNEDSFL